MSASYLMVVATVAFALAAAATPAMRRVAIRLGVLDRPSSRKEHASPVPLLGGLGIWGAVVGSLLLLPEGSGVVQLAAILLGASWISLSGLCDDRFGLPPWLKLLAQLIAAAVLVVAGVHVALPGPDWLDIAITLLWVLGITNAFNLLDNMDGLASGVGAVAAACFVVMSSMNGQLLVGALAAAVLGACLGFLAYNFNPARIFMGDSGSLFLGFVLAAVGIKLRFPTNTVWVTWMVPVLVLGVPIFDTTLVVVSRLRRGLNPFTTPGRDHVSHRLVGLGWTRREAVLLLYLAGCTLGAIAMFISQASASEAYAILLGVAMLAVVALVRLERHGADAAVSAGSDEGRPA